MIFKIRFAGASRAQLVLATRQLATLVKAGMPLLRALHTISDQVDPGPLRETFAVIARDVEGGIKLSEALSRAPQFFQPFYVNMVRAGEVGGLLDEILLRLADLMEKDARLKARVKAALMYPAFVMLASFAILIVLMVFVVPTFVGMFAELGSALPLPTQILVTVATIMRTWWWAALAAAFGLGLLFRMCARSPTGKRVLDRMIYHAPIFGTLVQQLLIARFARTFGTLLSSGVPILSALSTVRATVTNSVMDDALGDVAQSLKVGESLARPMELSGVFPPLVSRMIALGEETGQLDKMLVQLAASYEEQVDVALGGLTQLIEPVLIVFVGGIVGFIVIAMFLPMMSLTKILG